MTPREEAQAAAAAAMNDPARIPVLRAEAANPDTPAREAAKLNAEIRRVSAGTARAGVAGKVRFVQPAPDVGVPVMRALDRHLKDFRDAQAREANTSFIDRVWSANQTGSGVIGAAIRAMADPDFADDYTPGYVVSPDSLVGMTEDEADLVRGANSVRERDFRIWQVEQDRERAAEVGGGMRGFLASMAADAPAQALLGMGVASALGAAGLGSMAAARAGNLGGAVGRSVLEQGVAGAVASGVETALGGRVSAADFALDVAGGIALGVPLELHGLHKLAGYAQLREQALAGAEAAMRKRMGYDERARAALGPNATEADIAQQAMRMEADDLRAGVSAAVAGGKDKQYFTDLEKAIAEEEAAAAGPSESRATSDRVGMRFETSTNDPNTGKPVLAGGITPMSIYNMPTGANDRTEAWAQSFDKQAWMIDKRTGSQIKAADLRAAAESTDPVPIVGDSINFTRDHMKAMKWLQDTFIGPNHRIVWADIRATGNKSALGDAFTLDPNVSVVRIDPTGKEWASVLAHEVGHITLNRAVTETGGTVKKALDGLRESHSEWVAQYVGRIKAKYTETGLSNTDSVALQRGAVASVYTRRWAGFPNDVDGFTISLMDIAAGVVAQTFKGVPKVEKVVDAAHATTYIPNLDEYTAEQMVKYVEAAIAKELDWKPTSVPMEFIRAIKAMWDAVVGMFTRAQEAGLVKPDERVVTFFDAVRKRARAETTNERRAVAAATGDENVIAPSEARAPTAGPDLSWMQDPIAVKYGLDKLPVATAYERAEGKALLAMYKRADNPDAVWNNIPKERINALTAQSDALASTALVMFRSENPLMRMYAAELLESTTGAAGRAPTAALAKYLMEGRLKGNVINETQKIYEAYRKRAGGNVIGDYVGGDLRTQFNREVAIEIESRLYGDPARTIDPIISAAADVAERAFDRIRQAQVDAKTTGWASLPATSRGYMPHQLSASAVRNASEAQINTLWGALVDQFQTIEGWDASFSANLASKYIDRVRRRALGGFRSEAARHSIGAADIVEDALEAMGMDAEEVRNHMLRYMRGGAGHTQQRIKLDLLKEYPDGEGTFRLLDLFETDPMQMVINQAQRVSGEVALAGHGIMGRAGAKLVRRAMEFGDVGNRVTVNELAAFDQTIAEFLGDPFGAQNRNVDRVLQATSLSRLGGMGFTQAAEGINAAVHLGLGHAFSALAGFRRLRGEVVALARGERVSNPVLSSIELHGGREFGTDAYKMVFPFDNPTAQYEVAGAQTLTLGDRLLRGGVHAQGKLSAWRAIHSVQQRGVAEQIVLKALRYIREGKEDVALADMGFTPDMVMAVRAQYDSAVKLDSAGRVQEFDVTKLDTETANAFVQAVHRGTSQIIQGTFIGERGKWAHDGWLKLLTQFRTFSLTSVEKQWARSRANHGVAKTLAMLVGSMSMAAPIYMARVYAASVGRPDQDEYLEKKLALDQIARATLNYVALAGLSGDVMDALGAVSGHGTTGGRLGTGAIGDTLAPSVGWINDVYESVQNTDEGTDVHGVLRNLPFANLPVLLPAMNLLRQE